MTIQERRAKLVDETVEYYLTHPRSNFGALCCYYREIDGKVRKCAIGRLLDDEVARALAAFGHNTKPVSTPEIVERLPASLLELGVPFLDAIQGLHDDGRLWDGPNATSLREERVRWIKTEFCSSKNC